MISALLIDDELKNLENLAFLLENDCNGIRVVEKLTSAIDAREWLQYNKVDVIFLDINMPKENGFDFLKSIAQQYFQVIFVTAYNEFAIQAIKANAFDYILKPINIDELKLSVSKLNTRINNNLNSTVQKEQLAQLLHSFEHNQQPKKIALPQLGGISFIDVDDMVSLQADSNYTIIHLLNMQKKVISKTLKDFEDLLDASQFARIHKSYIINLKFVKEYSTIDGGIVKMIDGNHWSISRRQLDSFLSKMKIASLMFNK